MTTLSGYSTTHDFWGTQFSQIELKEISLHVTVDQITAGFIQKPDTTVRLSHNRAIKPSHAESFASYLIRGAEDQTRKWSVIVPALSLFTSPMAIAFEVCPDFEAGEVQFGIVRIEKSTTVQIWDGQHRTLGAYLAVESLNRIMGEALNKKAKAEAAGEADRAAEFDREAVETRDVRRKLGRIVIPVTIALETNKERIAELFSDVADNAKGINATALARLDQRNVFNRVAAALYEGQDEWTLLAGMIDDDNAYVTQNNPNWTTYRDVAAVAQVAWLGYGARWTENKEETGLAAQDGDILANAREFFGVLTEAFPEIDDVLSGTIEPSELRGGGERTSLLSSSTTIKALASAFHDLKFGYQWVNTGKRSPERLTDLDPMDSGKISQAFAQLPSLHSGSDKVLHRFWKSLGVIEAPYVAPTARAGNVRSMSMAIVNHAHGDHEAA
ncbi:MAG: DNA sulfur modification protein DndB [Acidimicrobiales bacterium]